MTTPLATLAAAIAGHLSAKVQTHDEGGDPIPMHERAWLDLTGARAGLVVVLTLSSYGADKGKVRASMSQTKESRGGADYREAPDLYKLSTQAALTRTPAAIAKQIESKLLPPAVEMLEAWKVKQQGERDHRAQLEASVARWQVRFPKARILMKERDHDARFDLSTGTFAPDYRYVSGRIRADGGLYLDRISDIRESDAMALVAKHIEG